MEKVSKVLFWIAFVSLIFFFSIVGFKMAGFKFTLNLPQNVFTYNSPDINIGSILNPSRFLNAASVFLADSITVGDLYTKYALAEKTRDKKIRVFIMPGHEPNYGGAEYRDLLERDMTVELAQSLAQFFQKNSHYEVFVGRGKDDWNPTLLDYFNNNWDDIVKWKNEQKAQMGRLINDGVIQSIDGVSHVNVPSAQAIRLYGINKWVNENNFDIAIHIHFNDYPRRNERVPGDYSGFTIYVPEKQYSNSKATKAVSDFIFKRLSNYSAVSNMPKESVGVVEDQDLVAVGGNNSVDAVSMLIEYGYIYEPQFKDKDVREAILNEYAFQTYAGVQDFFGSGNDVSLYYNTVLLPYKWNSAMAMSDKYSRDVLSLQMALSYEGLYPGKNNSRNECPLSGKFGPCTQKALIDFQKENKIEGERGTVGKKTIEALNFKFGIKSI